MRTGQRAGRREEAGSHLGCLVMKVCSDGTSSFHKTASHSPGSPLCPEERGREKKEGNTMLTQEDETAWSGKLKV